MKLPHYTMPTIPENLNHFQNLKRSKLAREAVRHLTSGFEVVNLSPGPGVTVRIRNFVVKHRNLVCFFFVIKCG